MAIATDTISYFSTQSMRGANLRPVPQGDRLVGRLLGGKYRLIERIGRGAYGSVYRAEQLALGRDVAVKILRPGVSDESAFFAEAWGASRVHHPNVVTIFDYGETDRLLFLVMEYVAGVTLSEIIDGESPLPVPRVLSLMLQLAQGLEAVHRAGIVHADLKSSNIMVSPLPHGELIKLVDFGIARRIDAAPALPASPLASVNMESRPFPDGSPWAAAPALASPGDVPYIFGTPGYMAPEVIRGIAPDFAADVYAAGVILYRLLTGLRPFAGETPEEIFQQQLHSEPMPPSMLRAHAPLALERIALRALARNPEDRFANGTELRRALEAVAVALVSGISPSEVTLDGQEDEQTGSMSRNRIGTDPGSECEESAMALQRSDCA